MILLTPNKSGPLVGGGWYEETMYGVVTERARNWIKVAFEAGPTRDELRHTTTWRSVAAACFACKPLRSSVTCGLTGRQPGCFATSLLLTGYLTASKI